MPNVIAIVDDNFEVSILIDSNEEEEKKGEEKGKDFEIELLSKDALENSINNIILVKALNLQSNKYSSLFKELISPPPELNI